MKTPKKPALKSYFVTSGYGGNTRRPFVEILAPELRMTISSAEARHLALNILEAAITSEADGLIVEFFTKELDATQEQAAAVLMRFREYRKRWRDEADMA
jgi:hypothetical protein